MKRKLLTTTLLSMGLLSFNLSAGNQMKCNGKFCMIDLSENNDLDAKVRKIVEEEPYVTLILDNIETIVFVDEKYIMTEDEIGEYELEKGLKDLVNPVLTEDGLPIPKFFCEDNLKPVQVEGKENTFECA